MDIIKVEECRKYDITSNISPYLDPRMLLHVLEWLGERSIYPSEDFDALKRSINEKLNSCQLPEEQFKEAEARLLANIEPFQTALNLYKKDQTHRIGSSTERIWISALLVWANLLDENNFEFVPDVDKQILKLAKLYSDHGEYKKCKSWLVYYINVVSKYTMEGHNVKNRASCYWGIISCVTIGILLPASSSDLMTMSNVTHDGEANKELTPLDLDTPQAGVFSILKLAELLNSEEMNRDRRELVLSRCWFLHWALFFIFKYHLPLVNVKTKGVKSYEWPQLQEIFLDDRNMAVVHLVAPHLLRYYAVYAILNRNRKDHFRTISNAIYISKSKYSDTFTLLLGALFVDFNFEAAQQRIAEIRSGCYADYFLEPLKDAIEENSRHIIFETYCRIHKSINLDLIAQKVNMTSLEAERWIVNLIRNSHLEAKIDSEKHCVEISTVPPNLYQQVIEKTQNLALRSNMILQNLLSSDANKITEPGMRRITATMNFNHHHPQQQQQQQNQSQRKHMHNRFNVFSRERNVYRSVNPIRTS
ncbi:bifunctional Eukaryotic translation initiation factor 3 subunit E/Winged helix DNA-binding domain superfamily/Eukaryotic translation initiation factor 3 subunit E [Babesia duncani]|uniref:Eukaryotic translation initiation factor 3 subunit E n=1 Tax=Babesia duncani TaxID=323732 RepID=A0AAD9PL08_9APIC|nr:bifunctional Eukaryotic translation initiation factor 3 subunit E/Winged helix DNA-binding domain superfamily/Eukaryotic translation initiation factor 3 subunit E [Babesia duncani]